MIGSVWLKASIVLDKKTFVITLIRSKDDETKKDFVSKDVRVSHRARTDLR
jgi:hypothetical protein